MSTAILLDNITKEYNNGRVISKAVNNVSLEIKSSEFVSIVGSSGSGKSTLLSIIGLIAKPSNGTYELYGQPMQGLSRSQLAYIRNKYIGWIFQGFNLLPELNVLQNILLPTHFNTTPKAESIRRANELLELVHLSHRKLHYPNELSGGQQQRVAIARGLIMNPSLIIADEPTGNLDTKNSHEIIELLKSINNEFNTTVLIVTHDEAIANIADRKLGMDDGFLQCL